MMRPRMRTGGSSRTKSDADHSPGLDTLAWGSSLKTSAEQRGQREMGWFTETPVAAIMTITYTAPGIIALASGIWAEHRHGQYRTRQEEMSN